MAHVFTDVDADLEWTQPSGVDSIDCISRAFSAAGIPVKNQPAWFAAMESTLMVALLFHGAEVNLWHGMSQSEPRRLLHTWPLQDVQQEPLLKKLLTENVPNTLNCLQPMSFNQWQSSHMNHSAKQPLLSWWTWAATFPNVLANHWKPNFSSS